MAASPSLDRKAQPIWEMSAYVTLRRSKSGKGCRCLTTAKFVEYLVAVPSSI